MKFNRFTVALACCLILGVGGTTTVQASIVNVGDTISFSSPSYRIGNGGEFKVNRISPNAQTNLFRTFCVELSEQIGFNTNYKVGGITTGTVASNRALTKATAALYLGFRGATGNILGQTYSYGGGALQGTDGRSLQLAIWKTMGWDVANGFSGAWGSSLNTEYNNDTKAKAWVTAATAVVFPSGGDAFGWVRVINVVGTNGSGNFQDQLTLIPEPGSFLIWSLVGIGLISVVRSSRRRG